MTTKKRKALSFLLLYSVFLLYSLCLVLAKLAGSYSLFSKQALLLYGSSILVLGIYALLWQQVLKRLPLTIAYPNKAVVIPLGVLWGVLLFEETFKWNMLLGSLFIACGILLVVTHHE